MSEKYDWLGRPIKRASKAYSGVKSNPIKKTTTKSRTSKKSTKK